MTKTHTPALAYTYGCIARCNRMRWAMQPYVFPHASGRARSLTPIMPKK
ncbi:hypothetical protein [Phocaeicola salanitronis]|nr:hypothetical protein [Phocaeicola salanitronis]